MATVVIVHAPEDLLPARALADKLRPTGLDAVIDQSGAELRTAVQLAAVTIGLWSPRSVTQQSLIDEVLFARGVSKVVHVRMQNAAIPDALRGDKSVDLTGWRGENEFPAWRDLANLVTQRAGVPPLAPPRPLQPMTFFQPGRIAGAADTMTGTAHAAVRTNTPRPVSPRTALAPAPSRNFASEPEREKQGGGMIIAAAALIAVAVLGGGGYLWWSQQQSARATLAAWDTVDRNDATALRAFISSHSGSTQTQAQGALSELEERSFEAVSDTDTIEALRGFLRDFPDSQHALAARGRIAELQANPDAAEQPPAADGDQQANPDAALPTAPSATPAAGGPAALTPPAEPNNAGEPDSATTTTTQSPTN